MTEGDAQTMTRAPAYRALVAQVAAQAQVASRVAARAAVAALLIGGVVATPLLAALALVALVAPTFPFARHAAPALIVASLVWLALAILGAHMGIGQRTPRDDADPSRL